MTKFRKKDMSIRLTYLYCRNVLKILFCCLVFLCVGITAFYIFNSDLTEINIGGESEIGISEIDTPLGGVGDLVKGKYIKSFNCSETLYFADDGNDLNDGLTPENPKKDPLPYAKMGGRRIMLKSGDVFNVSQLFIVGTNSFVSTYGGDKRATLSFVQTCQNSLSLFDISENIFSVKLGDGVVDTGWIYVEGEEKINWQKVNNYYDMKNENDYFIDQSLNVIYIKSNKNLQGLTVYYSLDSNGLNIAQKSSNVVIKNIEILGAGRHGISITSASNVLVENCYVHDIGGAYLNKEKKNKYGNGIQIWMTDTHDVFVCDNFVEDCFDAGLTAQITASAMVANSNKLIFTGNVVKNCNYCFEFFQYGTEYSAKNVEVYNNVFAYARDITEGYRITATDFSALLCLWHSENLSSQLKICRNYLLNTDSYSAYFSGLNKSIYNISDNIFDVDKSTLKYSTYYIIDDNYFAFENSAKLDKALYESLLEKYNSCNQASNFYFN